MFLDCLKEDMSRVTSSKLSCFIFDVAVVGIVGINKYLLINVHVFVCVCVCVCECVYICDRL